MSFLKDLARRTLGQGGSDSDSDDESDRNRNSDEIDEADDVERQAEGGGLFSVDDGTGAAGTADAAAAAAASATAEGGTAVFDLRQGAIPEGIEAVNETLLEAQQDGSTVLHVGPMAFLRVTLPEHAFALPEPEKKPAGSDDDGDMAAAADDDDDDEGADAALRAKNTPIEEYTLTMDIKLSAGVLFEPASLFQAAFPDPHASEEATLNPVGTVGCFSKEDGEALLQPKRWNRVVVVVAGSFSGPRGGVEHTKRTMTTYINGKQCMQLAEPMWGYGPKSRFAVDRRGFLLFASNDPTKMPGGISIKYLRFDGFARSADDIRTTNRVSSVFNQFARDLHANGERLLRSLALSPLYKRPHPTWYDPAFLSLFGDAHLQGTGLGGNDDFHGLARVLEHAFARMLDEQEAWLKDVLPDREIGPVRRSLATITRSVALFRRYALAAKGPAQLNAFLKKKGAVLAAMAPGDSVWVPAGRWQGAQLNPNMMLSLRRNADGKTWRVHVVNVGDGRTFHPAQADPPKIRYKTVVSIAAVPAARILGDAWWVYALTATCFGAGRGPESFYDHLLPFLTEGTWATHAADAADDPQLPWRSLPRSGAAAWRCMIDALVADWMGAGVPYRSAKYVLFNIRRQFVRFAMHDLAALSARGISDSDRAILKIAGSQVTRRALKHAEYFGSVAHLRHALEDVQALEGALEAVPPTPSENTNPPAPLSLDCTKDATYAHHVHPLFDRLLRLEDTDGLVGPAVPVPGFVPIDFLQIPERVTDFEQALTAIRYTDRVCTLLSVQQGVVKNAPFLKAALIQHVFTAVLPVPLGPRDAAATAANPCLWTDTPLRYGVQLDVVIVLTRIVEHFASSVLAINTSKSFDGVRIVVTGVIAAIADVALRKRSTDHPSELCTTLLEKGFGVGLGQFGPQSETIEVTAAEVHIARTGVIDYFTRVRESAGAGGAKTTMFGWEGSMKPCPALIGFLEAVGEQVAFPPDTVGYTTDPHALVNKNYPEWACYRDICYYWKFFMNTKGFPGTAKYSQRDAELQWGFDQQAQVFVVKAFGVQLEAKAKGHRWASGALASRYTAPVMAQTEDDLLHIHSFKAFDGVLSQQDIELLLSFLLVPYMRVPLALNFFATADRVNTLRNRGLRALLDSVLFEPSRYLPLGMTHAPTLVPSEEPALLATSYGVLINELHRSPDGILRAVLSLVAQARKLDVGTVYSSTVGVILYLLRLAARVETAIVTLLDLDAGVHPTMSCKLRDDVTLLPATRAALEEGLAVLRDALRTGPNSCHAMLESWLVECLTKMRASERDAAMAAAMAEHGEDLHLGSDADDDEDDDPDEAGQDGTLGDEIGASKSQLHGGGSAVMDKNTRVCCRLYAHLVLLHRNVKRGEHDTRSVATMLTAFHFLQTRHTWNHWMLDMPENELFDAMQIQRRNVIGYLHDPSTLDADAHHTIEAVVRVATTSGTRVARRTDVVRRWATIAGPRHAGRFTVATNKAVVHEVDNLADFDALLAKHARLVVDFHATWCVPCTVMGPVVQALAQHYATDGVAFVKVDVDKAPAIAARYEVTSMPTFISFVAADEARRLKGADPNALRDLADACAKAPLPAAPVTAAAAAAQGSADRFGAGLPPSSTMLGEEVNLQTHLVTLHADHLRALPEEVQGDADVQEVFECRNVPMQAAVVQSAQHRDHYRLVGRYHDLQHWKTPDPVVPLQECDREYDPGALGRHESWVAQLFEPVRMTYFNDPRNPIEFDMPEAELTADAGVAYLVAIHPQRGGTWKEVLCFKHWGVVHVYSTVSYGRRYYRTLEYSTDARLTLREMQPEVGDRQNPWPSWCRHGAGDPTADYPSGQSTVILRDAHVALGNISGGVEQFIPARLLLGTVPQALLDTHRFWQGPGDHLLGYPTDAEATAYYVKASLRPRSFFPEVQTAPDPTVAQILRIPMAGTTTEAANAKEAATTSDGTLQLVNPLYAPEGSALHSLMRTLIRLDNAGQILVWSRNIRPAGPADAATTTDLQIAFVQLPRLKLTFAPRVGTDGVERMYCVDHGNLFIANERPPTILHHMRGIPHSLLLSTVDREYTLLVPSLRPARPFIAASPFSSELVLDRNTPAGADWRASCATPYYLYAAHVSHSFLVAPALASALYLLVLRFSYRAYADVARLVDTVATDVDFESEKEEATIFGHLGALAKDCHPDAHASRLKISVAMLDSPVPTPWLIDFETAAFVLKSAHVTAECQLSVHEQLLCLHESDAVMRMLGIVASVIEAHGKERVWKVLALAGDAEAQLGSGFAEKRRFDLFFEEINSKIYEATRRRPRHEAVMALVGRVLRGIQLPEYETCIVRNFDEYSKAFVGDTGASPAVVPKAGEESNWCTAMLQKCLGSGPREYRLVQLQDAFLQSKKLTGVAIVQAVMAMFSGRTDSQGGETGYSFLFWYRVLTGGISLKGLAGVGDGAQEGTCDFVRLGIRLFADYSNTFLVSALQFMSRNPRMCAARGAPQWKDTRKSKDAVVATGVEDGDKDAPLETLFVALIKYLQAGAAQSTPPPNPTSLRPMPAPAKVVVVPAKQDFVLPVATSFPHGDVRMPTAQCGAAPVLFNTARDTVTVDFRATPALQEFFGAPLERAVAAAPGLIQWGSHAEAAGDGDDVASAGSDAGSCLPFDVSRHPYAESHVSQEMLKRFAAECQRYDAMRRADRVPFIAKLTDRAIDTDPAAAAAATADALQRLQEALVRVRDADVAAASEATAEALRVAHAVPEAPPAVPTGHQSGGDSDDDGAPRRVDHSKPLPGHTGNEAMERLRFKLRRHCGLESAAWVEYLVGAMLSDEEAVEWRKLNPFIGDAELQAGRDAVMRLVLHANRVGHANRALLEARDLAKLLRDLAASADVIDTADASTTGPDVMSSLRQELSKLQASAKQKTAAFAATLTQRRYHATIAEDGSSATVDPRFLVFEFTWNLLLRESQVTMVRSFMAELTAGRSSVWQMIMGAGKTTVVGPLLALLLSTGKQLLMQVVPPALLEFSRGVMRTTFSSVIRKRVYTFTYDRSTPCDPALYRKLINAQRTAGVVVANPTSVKSLELKYLELLTTLADPTKLRAPDVQEHARELEKVLSLFRGGVLLLDEVDLTLHPLKSELNFPIGPKEALDFSPLRWLLAIHVIDAIFFAERRSISVDFHESARAQPALDAIAAAVDRGYASKALQSSPHLVLLDPAFYRAELLPPLAEWLMLWMEKHSFAGLKRADLLEFLVKGPTDAEHGERLRGLLNRPEVSVRSRQMAVLAHDWLRSYLPHVLAKVDRVSFGIMTAADRRRALSRTPDMPRSRCMVAIPFVGKDVPSDASEFAHPDIIIGLSILAYRYEGMRFSDFKAAIATLRETALKETGKWAERKTNRLYESWVSAAGGVIRGAVSYSGIHDRVDSVCYYDEDLDAADDLDADLDELDGGSAKRRREAATRERDAKGRPAVASLRLLKQCSADQVLDLYRLMRRVPAVIHWYLSELVFPAHMRFQNTKLSASGQDLGGDMLFPRRVGFSGTPSDLLPRELGTCNFEPGSDGAIIRTLTSPDIVSFELAPDQWSPKGLLDRIARAPGRRFHALIDTGALITGMSNLQVAQHLFQRGGLDGFDGVVYLDELDRKMVLVRVTGRVVRIEECGVPLERRFAFYDQVHTTGMDIRHTPHAVAALTLGKDMTFRDYAQGAYRMRGIAKGQRIHLMMPPEVHALLRRQLTMAALNPSPSPAPGSEVPARDRDVVAGILRDVAGWLVVNSMGSERLQFNQLCLQNVSNVYRKRGFAEILAKGTDGFASGKGHVADSDPRLGAALDLFHEPVRFDLETSCPAPRLFTDCLDELVTAHDAFIVTDGDKATVAEVRGLVQGIADDGAERAFNADMVREQEEEKEKMKEVVEEKELEITQFKDQQYERDHEAPTPWMFAMLSDPDMMLESDTGMGAREDSADDGSNQLSVFYSASEFHLFARRPLALPEYLKVSNNYFDRRWSGHRRVKNVVVTMDWVPDRTELKPRAVPHAGAPPGSSLHRTMSLLPQGPASTTEAPGLTREGAQMLVDCNFELSRAGTEAAQLDHGPAALSYEGVARRMGGAAWRQEHEGRHSVALSLLEAETVRRIMHVTQGAEVVDGGQVDLRLNIVPAENALMDATAASTPAPAYQRAVTANAWRFVDCTTHFGNPGTNYLLKALQRNREYERRCWFEQVIGCKRRDQKGWERTPVARVFNLPDEYAVLHLRVLALRVKALVAEKELLPFDAFQLMDHGRVGALSPSNVLAGMRWLGLDPTHDDVIDFARMAHPAEDGGVTYAEWLAALAAPLPPSQGGPHDGRTLTLAQHMAAESAASDEEACEIIAAALRAASAADDHADTVGMGEPSMSSASRAHTDAFDTMPGTQSTGGAANASAQLPGGGGAGRRQTSGTVRLEEDRRLDPIDDAALSQRAKQRSALLEELKRKHDQQQREAARDLTRAVRAHRRALQRKRGLDDNPSVNGSTLRWEFLKGFMPDNVTTVGLTEFREDPDGDKSLWAAREAMVTLPTGTYGCDWLAPGGGLDSIVYQWTFVAVVRLPSEQESDEIPVVGTDGTVIAKPSAAATAAAAPDTTDDDEDDHTTDDEDAASDEGEVEEEDTKLRRRRGGQPKPAAAKHGFAPGTGTPLLAISRHLGPYGRQISVDGTGRVVLEGCDAMDIIVDTPVTWSYAGDGGAKTPYGQEHQRTIERAYRADPHSSHAISVFGVGNITIDFKKMKQKNQASGGERPVHRTQDVTGARMEPGQEHLVCVTCDAIRGEVHTFVDGTMSARFQSSPHDPTSLSGPLTVSGDHALFLFGHHDARRMRGGTVRWCSLQPAILEPSVVREVFKQHRALSDWVCAMCSSHNDEAAVVCAVCESPRTAAAKDSEVATGQKKARTTWDCGCGFKGNALDAAQCGFCTMPRGHFATPGDVPVPASATWDCGCGFRGNAASAAVCGFCTMPKGHFAS